MAETAARAEAAVAEALGKRAEPSPEIVALCERIRTSIRERRPIDEDAAAKSDTQKVAQEAGQSLNAGIESDAQKVEGSYAPLNNPPAGTPALQPSPVQAPPATVAPPAIGAEGGAPDAIPSENLSLDADRDATNARVESSGINQPSAQPIQEPPFTTVREGQAELGALAENGPAQVATRQQEAIDRSRQDMAALQLQAVEALNASRAATVGKVSTGQTRMVGSEEEQRAAISGQAQAIFAEAQTGVTAALEPLQANAMAQWDAGVEHLSTEFHDHLGMVKRWIDDRHSGVGGWFVSGWDSLTGLPDGITDEYTKAEKAFGDGVCELLLKISSDVNTVIAAAEALIESARERINKLFADLPEGLRDWATQEQAKFNTQLDGLHEQATAARTSFVDGVSEKAVAAVAEVQAEVEQLREEAKGLIGKIADAIQAFIDDPIKAIINGLLNLVGIPPPRFWALVDKIAQVISDIADDPEIVHQQPRRRAAPGFRAVLRQLRVPRSAGVLGVAVLRARVGRRPAPEGLQRRQPDHVRAAGDGHHLAEHPQDPREAHRRGERRAHRAGVAARLNAHREGPGRDPRHDQGAPLAGHPPRDDPQGRRRLPGREPDQGRGREAHQHAQPGRGDLPGDPADLHDPQVDLPERRADLQPGRDGRGRRWPT